MRAHTEVTHDKREFSRFPVTNRVFCFRYGKQMSMRTLNISLGGLKLEANTDLRVGESLDFDILAKGTQIRCRGKILATEEVNNKVQARLSLVTRSDSDKRKLSDYLHNLYWGHYEKWVIAGILILSAYIFYVIMRSS